MSNSVCFYGIIRCVMKQCHPLAERMVLGDVSCLAIPSTYSMSNGDEGLYLCVPFLLPYTVLPISMLPQ